MNEKPPTPGSSPSDPEDRTDRANTPAAPPREPRRWGWLVPAVTFLLGLALAGIVVTAQNSGSSTASSGGTSSTATVSPTNGPPSSPVAVVEVPAACLSVADDAKALVDVAATAVTAARNLDASALSAAVRQLDDAQKAVTASADACRAVQTTLPSATPPPTPTP